MLNIIVVIIGASLASCASAPESAGMVETQTVEQAPPADRDEIPQVEDPGEEAAVADDDGGVVEFDPKNPPEEIYAATMLDIQGFVRDLDILIKAKNYDEWLKLLSPEYHELISSGEFLDTVSQQPRLKSQNIVLQNSRDYFLNVVVTSRADLRAHDIEFLTMTRVMVFTISQKGQRIRIYTLDRTPDSWEIVD
jgi:hypothetical protein